MKPGLLDKIPFPIAQIFLRARNAKSPSERHHNAYYFLEATVKYLAACGTQVYLSENQRNAKVDGALTALALPSVGQWVQILREISVYYSERVDASSHQMGPWANALTTRTKDLPACKVLIAKIAEVDSVSPGFKESFSPIDLFNLLPAYRNRHLGHGASAKESFYVEMGPLLLAAGEELLGYLESAFAGDLVFVEEKRELAGGTVVIERVRLTGVVPLRCDPLELSPEKAALWVSGKVYLDWGQGVEPLCLFPLLHVAWEDEQAESFFLNRSGKNDMPEFLSYASGKILKGEGYEPDFKVFLSRITKKDLDSGEVKSLREKSRSDSDTAPESLPEDVKRLGGFALYGELGSGGMGVVYLAEQESLHREVALKTLPFEKGRDPVRQARFLREIRSLSACESPRVVKVLDSGEERGVLWYAMELVDGVTLTDVIAEMKALKEQKKKLKGADVWEAIQNALVKESGRRAEILGLEAPPATHSPPPERFRPYLNKHAGYTIALLMKDGAEALQAIHSQDRPVIHRDVKPDNLMVTSDGELVLMDFGLARVEGATTLTVADSVLGTIRYAPPEQIRRMTKLDARADIYSLGATFHELATLQPLYDADSEVEMISKITDETSIPREIVTLDKDFPEDFSIILHKCIHKDVSQRCDSAKEVADDLQRFLDEQPILARKPSYLYSFRMFARKYRAALIASSIAVMALLLLATLSYLQIRKQRDIAKARELLARAEKDPEVPEAAALLAESIRIHPTKEARDACNRVFWDKRGQVRMPHMKILAPWKNVRGVFPIPNGNGVSYVLRDGFVHHLNLLDWTYTTSFIDKPINDKYSGSYNPRIGRASFPLMDEGVCVLDLISQSVHIYSPQPNSQIVNVFTDTYNGNVFYSSDERMINHAKNVFNIDENKMLRLPQQLYNSRWDNYTAYSVSGNGHYCCVLYYLYV